MGPGIACFPADPRRGLRDRDVDGRILMTLTLLPGESIGLTTKANAIVVPSEYGLSRFATDHLLGVVGMANRESIGGHLHVTNMRLAFEAHAFNRLKGVLSVPIPAITAAAKYRSGLAVGVEIETAAARLQFVSWSAERVLATLAKARREFGANEQAVLASVGRAIEDMRVRPNVEAANILATVGIELSGGMPSWVEALSLIEWRSSARPPVRAEDPDQAPER